MKRNMLIPIGINLKASSSSIAKYVSTINFSGGKVYHLPHEQAFKLSSLVFFEIDEDTGRIDFVVGKSAKRRGTVLPDQLIKAFRFKKQDESFRYNIGGRRYSPIDISAELLKHLLLAAENVEGPGFWAPAGIVVTVSHWFKQYQNLNIKKVVKKTIKQLYENRIDKASLNELFLGLLSDNLAAGIDYAFSRDSKEGKENILVFDIGRVTLELSILSVDIQKRNLTIELLAAQGNEGIGGDEFDKSFLIWLCEKVGIELDKLDGKTKSYFLKKVIPALIDAKHILSIARKTDITIPRAIETKNIEIDPVERSDFESCITGKAGDKMDHLGFIKYQLAKTLKKADMRASDITRILPVGGSCQIPIIQKMIEEKFSCAKVINSKSSRFSVVRGAAIYAAYLLDKRITEKGQGWQYLSSFDNIEFQT